MLLLQTITFAIALWSSISYIVGSIKALHPKQSFVEYWYWSPIAITAWSVLYYLIHR